MIDKNDIYSMNFMIHINDDYKPLFDKEDIHSVHFIWLLSYINKFTRLNFFKFYKAYLFKIHGVIIELGNSENSIINTLSSLFDENKDYYNLFILSFFYYF